MIHHVLHNEAARRVELQLEHFTLWGEVRAVDAHVRLLWFEGIAQRRLAVALRLQTGDRALFTPAVKLASSKLMV